MPLLQSQQLPVSPRGTLWQQRSPERRRLLAPLWEPSCNSCKAAAPQSGFSPCSTCAAPRASSQPWWAWLLGVALLLGWFFFTWKKLGDKRNVPYSGAYSALNARSRQARGLRFFPFVRGSFGGGLAPWKAREHEYHKLGLSGHKVPHSPEPGRFLPFSLQQWPSPFHPKDNMIRTVVFFSLIHSLSCASDKNMAKKSIAAIMNALHSCLKSRALSQMVQIILFSGEGCLSHLFFIEIVL